MEWKLTQCKYEPRGDKGLEGFELGQEYPYQEIAHNKFKLSNWNPELYPKSTMEDFDTFIVSRQVLGRYFAAPKPTRRKGGNNGEEE